MTALVVLGLLGGMGALALGAELLVRGASRLATLAGLSPLVIGLTVVAFATSAPELVVSVGAALTGRGDIAVGNVVGSNIFNVLVILGIGALIAPIVVTRRFVRVDVPIMIGISIMLLVVALDGRVSTIEGALLLAGLVAYTVFAIRESRKEDAGPDASGGGADGARGRLVRSIALVLGGLGLLIGGAKWFVESAEAIARAVGVSDLVIGLTIVAAGTSLPELAASIVAVVRGERDIAVGNIIGSNIHNVLAIVGVAALVAPGGITVPAGAVNFDIPVMVAAALACLPIFVTGHRVARWEGGLFVGYYVAYVAYLVLASLEHDALPWFSATMFGYVLPLTGATLLVVYARAVRRR